MTTWLLDAKCAKFEPGATAKDREQRWALFHPPTPGDTYQVADIEAARRFCREPGNECPVRAQCLEFGHSDRHGIYDGTTPEERRHIRERRPQGNRTGDWRAANPPTTLRSKRECPEPGRERSVQRHLVNGQRLCLKCAEYDAYQARIAVLDEQVGSLLREGRKPSAIARELGLDRETVAAQVKKLRKRRETAA